MIFRAINNSGDWQFGSGKGSYFTQLDAVMANVKTSLLFFLNDYFAAMDFGIDWWNLLGTKQPLAEQNILLQTRAMLASCEGVTRINSVEATVDSANRVITIHFSVDTLYSRNTVDSIQVP